MIYDADRARLRGTLEHLAVLGQLMSGREVDAELAGHLQDLRTGGAIVGTEIAPDLQELVATFAHPQVVIALETSSPAGVVRHSLSLLDRSTWVMEGWGGTDEVTWWPCEPQLIVPTIANLVALRRRDVAPGVERRPVRATLELVERALEALRQAGPEHRATALAVIRSSAAEALAPEAVESLIDLLAAHRGAWRASLLQQVDGQPQVRGLAVVDAGPLGLWRRTAPVDPVYPADLSADTEVVLEPTTPGQVWTALTDLLRTGRDEASAA